MKLTEDGMQYFIRTGGCPYCRVPSKYVSEYNPEMYVTPPNHVTECESEE